MVVNGWSKIRIEDNTDVKGIYNKGYTELEEVTNANRGFILESKTFDTGDEIYFYPYGIISTPFGKFIKNKNIFIRNSKLIIPGVLTARVTLTQTAGGFIIHSAVDYLMCVYSNLPEVKRGDIIIVGKYESLRMNYWINGEYRRLSFFQPQAIRLIMDMDLKTCVAGPDFTLVENMESRDHWISNSPKRKGTCKTHFYSNGVMSFIYNNKQKTLVRKADIIAIKKNSRG